MAGKRDEPEGIVSHPRQVDVPVGQGMPGPDAIRHVSITEQTDCRRRKRYGGMGTDRLKQLKKLHKKNERLRRAVGALTLDEQIPARGCPGNFQALHAAADALIGL